MHTPVVQTTEIARRWRVTEAGDSCLGPATASEGSYAERGADRRGCEDLVDDDVNRVGYSLTDSDLAETDRRR